MQFEATVAWERAGQIFTDQRYSRAHHWSFDGGLTVPASSSPLSVPLPMSDAANVDPEEAFVAALSSCHMLFFLSIAAQKGFVVESYTDHAQGTMTRNAAGKMAMTRVVLRPAIAFAAASPSTDQMAAMHHTAHEKCYLANSVNFDVVVEGIG
jgi:organic hydroperoxide reductase OsmC/OhrA